MNYKKLRGCIAENGLSQKKVATKLGISEQALNAKLNNRSPFTLNEAVRLVEILGISDPNAIFFAENIPYMQRLVQGG